MSSMLDTKSIPAHGGVGTGLYSNGAYLSCLSLGQMITF